MELAKELAQQELSAKGESIEQAAYVHGMDLDELLGRLNEYAQTKEA